MKTTKLSFLLILLTMIIVWGKDPVSKDLSIGETMTLNLRFAMKEYKISPPDGKIIRVEEADTTTGRKLRIIGLNSGECTLTIYPYGNGPQDVYRFYVSDIGPIKQELSKVAHSMGLTLENRLGMIVVKGELDNHEDWRKLLSILKGLDEKKIRNDVTYTPGPEDLNALKKILVASFAITEEADAERRAPGEIFIRHDETGMTLVGRDFTEKQREDILKILNRCQWIAVNRTPDLLEGKVAVWVDVNDNPIDTIWERLSEIKGLELSKRNGVIYVKGKVISGRAWNDLDRILSEATNAGLARNNAIFVPSNECITELEQILQEAGYECVDTQDVEFGQLNLKMTSSALILTGEVGSDAEKNEVLDILHSQKWLTSNTASNQGQLTWREKIDVIPSAITVDIAFVGITRGDAENFGLGDKEGPALGINLKRVYDAIFSRSAERSTQFTGTLEATLKLLASNNISRSYKAGTVKFLDNTKGKIHIGGTQYLMNRDQMKEIEYGFILEVSGQLINKKYVKLTCDLENSYMKDENEKKQEGSNTTYICRLDQTNFLGGFKSTTDSWKNSGVPYLRNIPVVKWFVGNDSGDQSDIQLIVLAYPHISNEPIPIPINVVDPEQIHKQSQAPINNIEPKKKNILKPWTWR